MVKTAAGVINATIRNEKLADRVARAHPKRPGIGHMPATSWSPVRIEIEPRFEEFVRTFRGGKLVRDLMPDLTNMPLNADYLFPNDNVIAELKCLEKNPMEASDWPARLAKAFRASGHNFSDLIGYLVRGEPMPEEVKAKLFNWLRDAIRNVVKGGNRQIRASKRELGRRDAKGVLLIANDNNYGFGPKGMMDVISDAAWHLNDNHVDAVVYFTPNVFHRAPDSDVAWIIWDTRYRDPADLQLGQFVNELGRKWYDFLEVVTGDPFVDRREMPELEEVQKTHSAMSPIRAFGRQARSRR